MFPPILFVIYVNGLTDNLTIDHLLYADDVKLIAPPKTIGYPQSSLLASSKWSEDWELILNPSKSEHFQSCCILLNIPHLTQRAAHSGGQLCP